MLLRSMSEFEDGSGALLPVANKRSLRSLRRSFVPEMPGAAATPYRPSTGPYGPFRFAARRDD